MYLGRQVNSKWSPYFIAVLVTFLFGALQGVQDKLDDPFDGMSEDDINLGTVCIAFAAYFFHLGLQREIVSSLLKRIEMTEAK